MKKLFIGSLILCFNLGLVIAQDSNQDIVSRLHSNGLTKYLSANDFRSYDSITRGEAAKFMVEYAQMQNMSKVKSIQECQFVDIINYDSSLKSYIVQACEYGIFKGSNGKYMPNNNITKGEAIAVIVRSAKGIQNEDFNPWYTLYYEKGSLMNISVGKINTFDQLITRIQLGLWLKEIYKSESEDNDIAVQATSSGTILHLPEEILDDGTKVYRYSTCDHVYYRGPQGGCYYINGNDNKIYDTSKKCCMNK